MMKANDTCTTSETHPEAVERALSILPSARELQELAETFKTLGDGTRLGILGALGAGELCVCDLAETLSMSHSAVSHQLRLLRGARLVKFRRHGKNVFYSLNDEHVNALVRLGLDHLRENSEAGKP